MPLTIVIADSEGNEREVEVIRSRRYYINGVESYECLVRVNGHLEYAYASA